MAKPIAAKSPPAPARQLDFSFPAGPPRRADVASDEEERLVWMLLALIRERRLAFGEWYGRFGKSRRTFDRDVAKLRGLGAAYRFALRRPRDRPGVVVLAAIAGVADPVRKGDSLATETLVALVDALGSIVAETIRGYVDLTGSALDGFLRLATPRLAAASAVAETYRALREAWAARAAVRFTYPTRDGASARERIVEPYLVSYHSGRYYLVGFDSRAGSGGWRQYALDRIAGRIGRAGTFRPKVVPERYGGRDAVGLFKHETATAYAPGIRVTILLSPVIAAAVTARLWQTDQHVESGEAGSAITFTVHDLGEAVRWAFGFGSEARVVAPPQAVELARRTARDMLAAHTAVAERSAPA